MPDPFGLLAWAVALAFLAGVAVAVGHLAARLFVRATRSGPK